MLDSIEKGGKASMTDKAWKNGNPTALYNCFRKCGFKQTQNEEQSSVPPKATSSDPGWRLLPDFGGWPFEDYVHVNDHISVYGALTDVELSELDENEEETEEK